MRPLHIAACGLVITGLACMGCGAPPRASKPVESVKAPEPDKTASYAQSMGALSDHDVNEAFKELYPAVERCLQQATERVEGVAGTFTVALRIRTDGRLRWAYLRDSTLGDRAAERCILRAATRRSWPKPVGGEGEADHTFAAETEADLAHWKERQLRSVMTHIRKALHPCLREAPGRYRATIFIGRAGRVVAAGVAPPSPEGESQSDCIAERLRGLQFGRQPKLTKVSFVVR